MGEPRRRQWSLGRTRGRGSGGASRGAGGACARSRQRGGCRPVTPKPKVVEDLRQASRWDLLASLPRRDPRRHVPRERGLIQIGSGEAAAWASAAARGDSIGRRRGSEVGAPRLWPPDPRWIWMAAEDSGLLLRRRDHVVACQGAKGRIGVAPCARKAAAFCFYETTTNVTAPGAEIAPPGAAEDSPRLD